MSKVAIAGKTGKQQALQVCSICGDYSDEQAFITQCPTCDNDISLRKTNSLQKNLGIINYRSYFYYPG